LGLLLAGQGHDVEAEQELKQASQIAPNEANVLPVLANLQSKLGRSVDSTCTLKRLVELQPLSAQAHVELGIALTDLYSYQAALEEFSKAARLGSNPALVRLYKGRTLYDLGRIEDARQDLQASCALSPKVAACWYLLALVERQANKIPLSITHLENVVSLEPQNPDAEFLLGQSWFELGKTERAIEHWKMALQAFPDQWRSLYSLAQALRSSGDADAQKYQYRLQRVEQRHHASDRVGLLSQLAQESAVARDWPAVITRYQEALRECGHCNSAVELHRALGITYCQVGRLGSGEHELRIALQLRSDDTRTSEALERIRTASEGTRKGWLSLCSQAEAGGQVAPMASDASR